MARPAAPPRVAPHIAAPARPSPRIAAPAARSAPSIQRAAPTSRAATRFERRQQSVQSRLPTTSRASSSVAQQQTVQSPRLQQLQSQKRLSRSERRELSTLQRAQQNAQKSQTTTTTATTTGSASSNRLQELQSKSRLSRSERRELSTLQRAQQQNALQSQPTTTGSVASTRLQQLQSKDHLSRAERRELRSLQQQNARQQQQNQPAAAAAIQQSQQPRALRTQAVTAQQATQGRFASGLQANAAATSGGRFAGRRAARLAARTAWGLGLLAPYVPWYGPVYYPYAYNDLFYYTFWPDEYDPGYWAYAYDDMFDGVFFPDGAPYAEYAADGPYAGPDGRVTTGSAPGRPATPGRLAQATREFCADQAKGVTAWPLDRIAEAVQPNEDQKGLLENLRQAANDAAAKFKEACPDAVPLTPVSRLQTMILRLQATDEAIQTVKPALVAFTNSLSDEQKARFNEIGAQLGQPKQQSANQSRPEANCSGEKAGISSLAINRIEDMVRPNDTQGAALDKLDAAIHKAVETLNAACPNAVPETPVGRLDVMQKRVEAMIDAANAVRPALEEFYTSLNDEQKAKFNRLGRQTARSGG
jgi:hypothetical protein